MNDHTHGEKPGLNGTEPSGSGSAGQPDLSVPLKRDRKLLRSNKPLPPQTSSAPAAPEPVSPATQPPVISQTPVFSPAASPTPVSFTPLTEVPPTEVPSAERLEPTPVEQLFGLSETIVTPADVHDAPQADSPELDSPAVEQAPVAEQKRRFTFGSKKKQAEEPRSDFGNDPDLKTHTDLETDPDLGADPDAGNDLDDAGEPESLPAPVAPDSELLARVEAFAQSRPAVVPSAQPRSAPSPSTPAFSGEIPRLGPVTPTPLQQYANLRGLDIAALAAAIVLPPVGLVLGIIAIIKGKQIRGWASDLARAAISVSLVMTIVFVAVGGYLWFTETEKAEQLAQVKADQRARALIVKASAPFCEVLAANPSIFGADDPDFGWPALDAPEGYLPAIATYSSVWTQLSEVAPAGILDDVTAISQRVAGVVQIASALGNSNRAGDLLGLHEKSDVAGVEAWYFEYCTPAETPAE